jgi:hypothetical protein
VGPDTEVSEDGIAKMLFTGIHIESGASVYFIRHGVTVPGMVSVADNTIVDLRSREGVKMSMGLMVSQETSISGTHKTQAHTIVRYTFQAIKRLAYQAYPRSG